MESAAAPKPVGQAIAIALSVFVGVTSIFAMIMAFGIAPFHIREIDFSGDPHVPDQASRWITYALAVVFLAISVFAFRTGRKTLNAALVCTAFFLIANVWLAVLYLKMW